MRPDQASETWIVVLGDRPQRARLAGRRVAHASLDELERLVRTLRPGLLVVSAPELERAPPSRVVRTAEASGARVVLLLEVAEPVDAPSLREWVDAGVSTWCSRDALDLVARVTVRRVASAGASSGRRAAWRDDAAVRDVLAFLESRETPLSVRDLARALATSERSLRRRLQQAGAPSPRALMQLKLLEAVALHRALGLSRLESAHRLGYATESELSRAEARAEQVRDAFDN